MGAGTGHGTEALLITGPCGAGKSTVGFACLDLLRAAVVPAAMVDAELVYLSTAPPDDPHNETIAEQGLAAVYRVYRDAGIRRLLLPRVLLYPRHLELVVRAVPDASLTTVWLDASEDVILQRLEGRESGDSVGWHLERARAVNASGMRERTDLQVDGERAPEQIAAELLAHVGWLPATIGSVAEFVPPDFDVPLGLQRPEFLLEPLGPGHNEPDYAAWTSSMEHIAATPGFTGGSWPREMTLDENRADLKRHADDFRNRTGFTYTVLDPASRDVIGCVYIYPARDPDYDASVLSWVRASRAQLDIPLWRVVGEWLASDWPFASVKHAARVQAR